MSITVTYQEGDNKPEVWTVSDEALESLERFRQTLGDFRVVKNQPERVLKYATVRAMLVGFLVEHLVTPALQRFPPAQLAALKQQAEDARALYEAAQAAAGREILKAPEITEAPEKGA